MTSLLNKQLSDKEAMRLAIEEAEKGQGFVSPNPPVGCVIVNKDKRFLSSGFYARYGGIHAEISALNKIQDKKQLAGAHLFVTLEPCAHVGQNPPCAGRLLKYPLASVIYGREDPNPKTKSQGLKQLRQKGIYVKKSPFWRESIQRLYEAFAFNMEKNRAFFALKSASSLDGVSALSHGESQWITGEEARGHASYLRACFSAVLIGVNAFLEDNPRLNCRKKGFEPLVNKVCILDPLGRSLDLISQSNLAKVRPAENIFVITDKPINKKKHPFKAFSIPFLPDKFQFDLKSLSLQLYKEKIASVLVEGGAKTFSGFLEQKAAQRLYHFINPCLLGGARGKYWTEDLSVRSLNERQKIKSKEILCFGEDIFITGALEPA